MNEGMDLLETVISWDIGQAQDYSAISVIQALQPWTKPAFDDRIDHPIRLNVGPMERLPLGTNYVDQRRHVLDVWKSLRPAPWKYQRDPIILMDITGVGRGIFDEIRHDAQQQDIHPLIYGIQFTGGHQVTEDGRIYHVPKIEAIQALIISAQNGQIGIRNDQPFATELKAELRNFRRKVTAGGTDTYSAAKESIHDDLVLSIAQAVWYVRRRYVKIKPRVIPRPPFI